MGSRINEAVEKCLKMSHNVLILDVVELPNLYGRYAHRKCAIEHPKDDREKMIIYLIRLYKFKDDMTWPRLL